MRTWKPEVPSSLPVLTRPSFFNRQVGWLLAALLALCWALSTAGLGRDELLNRGGWTQLQRFWAAALHPQHDWEFLQLTADATLVTLAFAISGSILSLFFGLIGGILGSEVWWQACFPRHPAERSTQYWWQRARFSIVSRLAGWRLPWLLVRALLTMLRSVHEIVWGLIFVNIIGLDPLTAILAIAIPFGAITAKVYAEIVDELPRAPFQALLDSGVAPSKALLYTLLPQAARDFLAYGFYRIDCAIRAAAVLGMIGAGGLGFQIFLSLKTLKYEQVWTFFYALILLNGLFDFWSALVRRRLGSTATCSDLSYVVERQQAQSDGAPGRQPGAAEDWVLRGSLWFLVLLVPFAFWYAAPTVGKLFSPQSIEQLRYIADNAWPPDFRGQSGAEWWRLTRITLAITIVATAVGGIGGLLLAFPAANNFLLPGGIMSGGNGMGWLAQGSRRAVWVSARLFLLVTRSIPPPVWALLFLFLFYSGILTGALALGVYTVGVMGRLMAEVTENLDERPLTALKTQGASSSQIFFYGVIPSTLPRFIAYLLYRWEEIVRATVVIGLVGAGGLGRLLVDQLSSFDNQGVLATLLLLLALTFLIDLVSGIARHAFR